MGVAAHQPAVFSQWLNRLEVLVGIVKAGRVVRRNSLQMDTGMAGLLSVFDPAASASRCKVPSSIRDMPNRGPDGRDTFRDRTCSCQ